MKCRPHTGAWIETLLETLLANPCRPRPRRGFESPCSSIIFDVFGKEDEARQDQLMRTKSSKHRSFVQLPSEARTLFFIYASAALARYQSHPPTRSELAQELQNVWDTHRLTRQDLSDPHRMTRLLKQYFATSYPAHTKDSGRKEISRPHGERYCGHPRS